MLHVIINIFLVLTTYMGICIVFCKQKKKHTQSHSVLIAISSWQRNLNLTGTDGET